MLLLGLMVFSLLSPRADASGVEVELPPTITEPFYPVTAFKIQFDRDIDPADLTADELLNQPVTLSRVDGVYTRPQRGAETVQVTLAALAGDDAKRFDVTAVAAINADLLGYMLDEKQLVGIVVQPAPTDLAEDGTDRRGDKTELTVFVRFVTVGGVRTLASGDRIATEEREDHPLHQSIRDRSPLQPGDQPRTGALLKRAELDDYLYRLNRHPGRRVDAAISPVPELGEATLDYLVAENKPWYVYTQLGNTGTDSTGEWRQRFGFVHNQLTANDDILSIDYITAGFDDSHVVRLGYDRPLSEHWRVRVHGLYSTYNADQVGSPLAFTGEDTAVGADLVYNFFQHDALFLDAVGGLEYYYTTAQNPAAGLDGAQSLFMGKAGIELDYATDLARADGFVHVRGNFNQADADEFNALGRTSPDTQFLVMQYRLSGSFYLEPLLDRAAWEDITTPQSSTLAHEIALSARGQWAVAGDRFVPSYQAVAGGINTVRGFEQAAVAGDSSIILTAEYRFHVPRIFGLEAPRRTQLFDRPFRVAPESVYGRPDWDLVLKGFVDFAYLDTTNELAFETDETMLSTGVGIELSLKNNVSLRADWGVVLQDAGRAQAGDNRLHLVLTILY